jgi:hypothetical protein
VILVLLSVFVCHLVYRFYSFAVLFPHSLLSPNAM